MTQLGRREVVAGMAVLPLAGLAATARAEGPSWTKLPTEPYRGKQDDISFIDAQRGWYGNGAGKLYATTDGGDSWAKVWDQPGTFIRALGFVDDQVGYLGNVGTNYYPGVTDTQPLYRTADGGKSWAPVTVAGVSDVAGICGIDIVRQRRIFQGELRDAHIVTAAGRVGGPAMMLRSEDSGTTWRIINLSDVASMILDVKFHDARTGFVAASGPAPDGQGDAMILMTADGGVTWKMVWRSGRPMENVWKMSWPSRDVGYATVQSYDQAGGNLRVIVKTVDGGKSWRELPLVEAPGIQQFGIGFVDELRGWVGTRDTGFETRDGGASWTPVAIGRAVNKVRILPNGGGKRVFAIGVDVHRLDL